MGAKFKCGLDEEICVSSSKHCSIRRKSWLPACSPFPTPFSTAFLPKGSANT